MRKFLGVISLLVVSFWSKSQSFEPQHGDLFFQDLDCGPFCDAIEKVTYGADDADFSHVGIAVKTDTGMYVIESVGKGTILTPLDTFLRKSADSLGNAKVMVGRVRSTKTQIEKSIERALSLLGRPYDDVFDIKNEGLYCSELVYFAFRDEYDQSIFDLTPMTFIDPDSGKTFKAWVDYFERLNVEIPEGKLGLNPGGLSRSPFVDIVFNYAEN